MKIILTLLTGFTALLDTSAGGWFGQQQLLLDALFVCVMHHLPELLETYIHRRVEGVSHLFGTRRAFALSGLTSKTPDNKGLVFYLHHP